MNQNEMFVSAFMGLAKEVNDTAKAKGWWDGERNEAEIICLMHSELSEALEALRHGNPPSDHISYSLLEEEMADVIIRIMDYAFAKKLLVPEALIAKLAFNRKREFKHGGKKF